MQINIFDPHELLSISQEKRIRSQLFFALVRFADQLQRVTVHFVQRFDGRKKHVQMKIEVTLQDEDSISIRRIAADIESLVIRSVRSIERHVAFRVDWRSCVNLEVLSTKLAAFREWISGGISPAQRRHLSKF